MKNPEYQEPAPPPETERLTLLRVISLHPIATVIVVMLGLDALIAIVRTLAP